MKKIIALALVLVIATVMFAACGGVKGEEKTQGNITVLVPDGYDIDGGIMQSDDFARIFNPELEISNNMQIVIVESVDEALENTNLYKGETPGEDVEIKAGDVTWTGVTYDVIGSKYTDVYATIGDKVVYTHGCGFDDETLNAILGSVKVK